MSYKDDYKKYEKYEDEYLNEDEITEEKYEEGYQEYEQPMGRKKLIEVEEVLGFGHGEITTEVCIPLYPPAFEVLENLIEKTVIFDAVIAAKDRVFINGRLIKNIPYKTKNETIYPGCRNISKLTFGALRHATAEIPFALCIKVPGCIKGAKAVILDYDVDSVEISNHLGCVPKSCVGRCEPALLKYDTCISRPFKSITEKDCISVKVKVVKPVILHAPHKHYEEC